MPGEPVRELAIWAPLACLMKPTLLPGFEVPAHLAGRKGRAVPDNDEPQAPTHVYDHPEGHGLGEHHTDHAVDGPLELRPAEPGVPLEHLLPEHRITMADLDLQHGAEVTVTGHDEDRDLVIFEWADKYGHPRRTSLDRGTFAELFTEVSA